MPENLRSFNGENDIQRMTALARQFPGDNLHVTDLPYRLSSWALDDPGNVRVWIDDAGQVVAWAVLQVPFWEVDIVCHPEYESRLYPQILDWADRRALSTLNTPNERPCWFINVFTGQGIRIRELENAGFNCQSDMGADSLGKVLLRRPGQSAVKLYPPPAGFILRSLAGEKEAGSYVDLHRSVFQTRNMTLEWRLRTLRQPDYRPDLDIIVEAPDGRLAAFCVCWLDEDSGDGRVEPLGCHQDFRCHALGRVALAEGLHRLQEHGAQTIHVETDDFRTTAYRLYESFGFQVEQTALVYKKDYGGMDEP